MLSTSQGVVLMWPGRIGVLLDPKTFAIEDLAGHELRRLHFDSDETAVQVDPSGVWLEVATSKRSGESLTLPIFSRYDADGNEAGRIGVSESFLSGAEQPPELIDVDGKTLLTAGTHVGIVDWSHGIVSQTLPIPRLVKRSIRAPDRRA
ncbi:MAG: hypothetical protein IAI49_14640 [Candidatus Eremiobacteraeota bacterium]|nr:hypothetical protein [Candidatus Eremiobacteraeota bacterium]